MKLFIPTPNEGWIGDVTTAEFKAHTRHEIVDDIRQADVVWCYSKWIADRFPIEILREKPCITTVHHIVPQKGVDIAYFDSFTDAYHVPNRFTFDELSSRTKKPIKLLPYWVPLAFKPVDVDVTSFQTMRPVPSFVFGSFQRDTEGASILSGSPQPKLEKGPDILVDVLSRFWDERYRLLLAGWRRQYVKSRVPNHCLIDYTNDALPDQKALRDHTGVNGLYNTLRQVGGVYLVTSRYEGGPQAILEAAAVGCKILSTTMGIAPDILHPACLCGNADDPSTIDAFESKVRGDLPWDEIVAYNYEQAQRHTIRAIIPEYDSLVERVYESKR